MKKMARGSITAAIAIALSVGPLTSCGGREQKQDSGSEAAATQTAQKVDVSQWKTLGDAFKASTGDPSYSYDESNFMGVLTLGDAGQKVHVVATMTPEVYKAISELDIMKDDFQAELKKTLAPLAIRHAEDITDKAETEESYSALVGKTGDELAAEGYRFASYVSYGGDEAIASYDKGYYSYEITFAKKVAESETEDGGAALKDAKATEVAFNCNISESAPDPACADAYASGNPDGAEQAE